MNDERELNNALEESVVLGLFKAFCENNNSVDKLKRLRNIYARTLNPVKTTKQLIVNELNEELSDDYADRMTELIEAFLNKKSYRESISSDLKKKLLTKQKNKCAICGTIIDIHSHADHIVPFKYVGDELKDNLQMLCSDCNLEKNASIDYQIKYLLKLTRRKV